MFWSFPDFKSSPEDLQTAFCCNLDVGGDVDDSELDDVVRSSDELLCVCLTMHVDLSKYFLLSLGPSS